MEVLAPSPGQASKQQVHFLDRALMLIKLYVEYYPKLASFIFFLFIGIFMVIIAPDFKAPVVRNRLHHDYSNISAHYDFQASQIDHWCLWVRMMNNKKPLFSCINCISVRGAHNFASPYLQGGDHDCKCLDFTEPEPRHLVKGWLQMHEKNKKMVKNAPAKSFDVVFVGDEMVERMVGTNIGRPSSESRQIADMFNKTFTKEGGGEFDGLALGIAGDAVRVKKLIR